MTHPDGLVHLQLAGLLATLAALDAPLPAGIHLRAADLATDLSLIAELYNAAFEPEGPAKVTPQEVAHFVQHPGLSHGGVFLAFDRAWPVGLGVGSIRLPTAAEKEHHGAIELLAVRPAYRRRGIGRALIHRVLTWLLGQGITTVGVGVGADSPFLVAALQRYGFREAPNP
jgi:GNAT superfamily N-acetyltransferase